MKTVINRLAVRLWTYKTGATAIEYALIAGIISLAIVSGATLMGGSVSNSFDAANNGFN